MATRSSGVSGAIYGLVIFVFLFVIALALAIMFYAQKAKTQEQLDSKTQELAGFVNQQGEINDPAYIAVKKLADDNKRTVFKEMDTQIDNLKRWLDGADKPLAEIENDMKTVGVGAGVNALSKIVELQGQLDATRKQVAALQVNLKDRSAEIDHLKGQFQQAQSGIAQERQSLSNQVTDRTKQFSQATTAYEQAQKQTVAELEKARADARDQVQQMQAKMNEMQTTLDKLNGRIHDLVNMMKNSRPSAPDMTLEADGQIIDVVPQDNMVYINLGKDDHLVLGMTFEVFDEGTGIRTEIERNGQTIQVGGKAKIEVVSFGKTGKTAACRVVHQAYGKPIVVGDLISNIVYDRNRTLKFFVFGDFDLDNNGQYTAADRERVLSLISKWGGQVVTSDEMPVDTDFLLLGREPMLPKAPPDNPPPTPEDLQRYLEAKKKYAQYYELVGQARDLSIPILNQNRFLSLIGYYTK